MDRNEILAEFIVNTSWETLPEAVRIQNRTQPFTPGLAPIKN